MTPRAPDSPSVSNVPCAISFGAAFRFWLQLGFISFGGPVGQIAIMHRELVEATRGNLKLTAPLAAVVGVIAKHALFFIAAVAYPAGAQGLFDAQPDWIALTLVLAAALALWPLKWGVITVIAASAGVGLSLRLLGLA
jgi:chromate transport protein ChrA